MKGNKKQSSLSIFFRKSRDNTQSNKSSTVKTSEPEVEQKAAAKATTPETNPENSSKKEVTRPSSSTKKNVEIQGNLETIEVLDDSDVEQEVVERKRPVKKSRQVLEESGDTSDKIVSATKKRNFHEFKESNPSASKPEQPVQKIKTNSGAKKDLFKQRNGSSQNSNKADLELKSGVSMGIKKAKIEAVGVGSHRTLPDKVLYSSKSGTHSAEKVNSTPQKIIENSDLDDIDMNELEEMILDTPSKASEKSISQFIQGDKPISKPVVEQKQPEKKTGFGPKDIRNNLLDGLSFAVTGNFESVSRSGMEDFIREKGGRLLASVTGKCNFLVAGYELEDGRQPQEGWKYKNAVNKGVQIYTETEFEEFVGRKAKLSGGKFTLSTRSEIIAQIAQIDSKKKTPAEPAKVDKDGMWTDKFAPKTLQDLVGNQGTVNQLFEWLRDWDDVQIRGNKKQLQNSGGRYNRGGWAEQPRINARAALLSGPPGIGKTSACRIICNHLGFEVLEKNASDVRNKTSISSAIGTLSGNRCIDYFTKAGLKKQEDNERNPDVQAFGGQNTKKSVIIMDEVDGVGAGDKGGIRALIDVIKASKVPIICICNDRQNRKLASLVSHCYDLKFQRPTVNAIEKRISKIIRSQNLNVPPQSVRRLIESSGQDIRHIINLLQTQKELGNSALNMAKDEKVMINNFEAGNRLLNCGTNVSATTFRDKVDLFFIDHDFVPMIVQESYLTSMGDRDSLKDIERMAEAADLISYGDILNNQIRQEQNWSLLPNYGVMSSVGPCILARGRSSYPAFPQFWGKLSTMRKAHRLIRELKQAMSHSYYADRYSVQNEMVPFLLQDILDRLKSGQVSELITYMDDLRITNEMVKEHLMGLSLDRKMCAQFDQIETKVKTAFTKEYNKAHTDIKKMKAKAIKGGELIVPQDDDNSSTYESHSEDDDDGVLLDENELNEIKKAKQLEKAQKKAHNAMKRLDKGGLTMVQRKDVDEKENKKGEKKTKAAEKGKASAKGKAPAGKGKKKK